MDVILIHDCEDEYYYNNLANEKNLTRWGWEFLRRNPEYQADYKKYSEFPDYDSYGSCKNGKYKGNIWQDAVFYVDAFHYTNPPALKGESYKEYGDRCPDGEIIPYSYYLERKYHFQPTPLAPERELNDDIWFFFCANNDAAVFGSDFPPWEIDLYPDYEMFSDTKNYIEYKDRYLKRMNDFGRERGIVIMAFDVRRDRNKQLAEAKEILIEKREEYEENIGIDDDTFIKVPSLKINMFPTYLRVLDGLAAGLKYKEIALIIYPNEKNDYENNGLNNKVKKNIEVAKRWRDYDYWKIPR